MKEAAHIRIVNNGLAGHTAEVFYVDEQGHETEISHVVTGLVINSNVGELTTAQLNVIKVKYAVLAKEQ